MVIFRITIPLIELSSPSDEMNTNKFSLKIYANAELETEKSEKNTRVNKIYF